ncbi:AraC family transcriptional regulator [Cohnella candidum]|uniref:AraC family transcriptional regulator n=1 Tax=Cohnella candidum TaxID=2674991 RepID=A0A3G3JXM9_9BACL|nr:AraC family transcriptional regulator [Cohnella candidum]AYQ72996.1 AraC family transcriptional regulator [Cohnella candidum]
METIRIPEGFDSQRLFIQPEYMQNELQTHELTRSFYVSDIGYFPQARFHYRERHEGCDSHIFIYCVEGEGWIEWNGGDRQVRIGNRQLAVIPAGTPHRYGADTDNPWTIYWFHLKGDHATQLIRAYGMDSGPLSLPLGTHAQWLEHFEQCFALLTDKTYSLPGQIHVSQTVRHLLSAIGISAGISTKDKKRERYLEQAIRYMTDRLNDSVTLPELSKHTGLSKQHLNYLFKKETGCPPVDYFLRMKMQRAGQMLDLTDLSVKEVCGAVGISDPYYFSRLFKKMMGVSPTEYRSIPKG